MIKRQQIKVIKQVSAEFTVFMPKVESHRDTGKYCFIITSGGEIKTNKLGLCQASYIMLRLKIILLGTKFSLLYTSPGGWLAGWLGGLNPIL